MVDLIDTNGVKPTLKKGVLGYDDYSVGGDAGRLYVGTGIASIAQAKKSEVDSKVSLVTSTDNAIARFDGTSGQIQNSGVIIDDSNNVIVGGTTTTFTSGVSRGIAIEPTAPTSDSEFRVNGSGSWFTSFSSNASGAGFGGWRHIGSTGSIKNWVYTAGSGELQFGTNGSERMRIDSIGNVGIGVVPSAWGSAGNITAYSLTSPNEQILLGANNYYNGGYKYATTGVTASQMEQYNGAFIWKTAPSGTAGNAISWTNAMTLDANGNLSVGNSTLYRSMQSGQNPLSEGAVVLQLYQPIASNTYFYIVNGSTPNSTATGMGISRHSTTLRSISASGTINASGADYAEYEYSNDITLVKGQIVGFKADGTLTDKYSEAIRFAIKSTNPSIVGGDTWGIEEIVGKRPDKPVKSEEMTDEEFAELEELYKLELADFEARLEVERQKVDRIAYAGKVPVNVYGAVAGQYVIAIEKDGGIDGKLVNKSDMTFAEYQDAVGRVNKILDDGRAEVAVIIH